MDEEYRYRQQVYRVTILSSATPLFRKALFMASVVAVTEGIVGSLSSFILAYTIYSTCERNHSKLVKIKEIILG
jgi:hypothetical protein